MKNTYICIGHRGSGKTTELLKKVAETGDYIVVKNLLAASLVFTMANNMNISINFPITYDEFIHREYVGKNISGFYIDNAEDFIRHISGNVPVHGFSVNIENSDDIRIL